MKVFVFEIPKVGNFKFGSLWPKDTFLQEYLLWLCLTKQDGDG
jgi:hypothetical protein